MTTARVDSPSDRDWYVFSALGGSMITVTLRSRSDCPLDGVLHVGESTDQGKAATAPGHGETTWQFLPYDGAAWFYLAVSAGSCDGADYEVAADYAPAPPSGEHPARARCEASVAAERGEKRTLRRLLQARTRRPARIARQRRTVRRARAARQDRCLR